MDAEILDIYVQILVASRQMLSLAKAQEWDALVEQESARQEILRRLQTSLDAQPGGLASAAQARANALIREILDADSETRTLAEQRMSEIGLSLQSVQVSKKLSSTYGAP